MLYCCWHVPIFHGKSYIPSFLYAQQATLEEILYQFEEKLQAEREEDIRKHEELQAQLQAQLAALEENQSLMRQAKHNYLARTYLWLELCQNYVQSV
jgi:cell shape-determining protein MreC